MKVEVAIPGSPFLLVLIASVDLNVSLEERDRAQGLCESRGGHPGLPVPTCPYGLCGRKAALNERHGPSLRHVLDQQLLQPFAL